LKSHQQPRDGVWKSSSEYPKRADGAQTVMRISIIRCRRLADRRYQNIIVR